LALPTLFVDYIYIFYNIYFVSIILSIILSIIITRIDNNDNSSLTLLRIA